MKFVKMQAQGNDFIIMQNIQNLQYDKLAKKLCDRHFGIGADGLVLLNSDTSADIAMRIFNADGSEAELCGSALRCVAKYISPDKKNVSIKTKVGIRKAEFNQENNIKVNIGRAEFLKENLISIGNFGGYYISTGNPHFVIFTDDLQDVQNYVADIVTDKVFTNGVNVEFVKIINKNEVTVRVFERGVGETLACGTGASAIQFAGFKKGILSENLILHFKGGDIFTNYADDNIYLSGKAEIVFTGEIDL